MTPGGEAPPSLGDPGAAGERIGVLALQGDVTLHQAVLEELGADVVLVRTPQDLEGIEGLVLPGGESTTLSMLLDSSMLTDPVAALLSGGLPAFGTCAGMILLASSVIDGRPDQHSFKAIDITVRRNAFGRQLQSFEADLAVATLDGGTMHAVFIRAPLVEEVGAGVEVLAVVTGKDGSAVPVVCRQGRTMVCSFHPELTRDGRLHARFLADVRSRRNMVESVGGQPVEVGL